MADRAFRGQRRETVGTVSPTRQRSPSAVLSISNLPKKGGEPREIERSAVGCGPPDRRAPSARARRPDSNILILIISPWRESHERLLGYHHRHPCPVIDLEPLRQAGRPGDHPVRPEAGDPRPDVYGRGGLCPHQPQYPHRLSLQVHRRRRAHRGADHGGRAVGLAPSPPLADPWCLLHRLGQRLQRHHAPPCATTATP